MYLQHLSPPLHLGRAPHGHAAMCRGTCTLPKLRLASLGAGDTPAPPLNNKTPAVATNRLLCASPCVRTALYVHRLVYAQPCMWTTARYARCGGHPSTPPRKQHPCCGHRPPFVCIALCVHRLVCAPPCLCTALYVDYGSLRSMRGTSPYPP